MKKTLFVFAVIAMSGSMFVTVLSVLVCHWAKMLASNLFVVGVAIAIASIITTIAYIVVVVRWNKVEEILKNIYNYRIN